MGVGGTTEEEPALRDATELLRRIEADEAEAQAVRERLRDRAPEPLPPDGVVEAHLRDAELAYDVRRATVLRSPGSERGLGYGGTLYLTSERLIHLGGISVNIELLDIAETSLAGERLLLTLSNGDGVSLEVDRPRTLRARMAAAVRELKR